MLLGTLPNPTEFIDEGYEWILHTGRPRSEFYNDHNTLHYQIFGQVPDYIEECAKENFKIYATSIIKQNPGMIIPTHTDTYYYFKTQHNAEDEKIVRWCVFLDDWHPGHYFDMNGKPIVDWKRGDYVELNEGIQHTGSNCGSIPKYTAQITGVKK